MSRSFSDLVRPAINIWDGFIPEKMPKDLSIEEIESLLLNAERLTPKSDDFQEGMYNRYLRYVANRPGPIAELVTYIKENYSSSWYAEINNLPFRDSTVGETIPLETAPRRWISNNMNALYEDWLENNTDTFLITLAYLIKSKIPFTFKDVPEELKNRGALKLDFKTIIDPPDFPLSDALQPMKKLWESEHEKKGEDFVFHKVTRSSFSGYTEAQQNLFFNAITEIIKADKNKYPKSPLVSFYGDTNIKIKSDFLKDIFNREPNLYLNYFRTNSPRLHITNTGQKVAIGAGKKDRTNDFANHIWGNLDLVTNNQGQYVIGEDLGGEGFYSVERPKNPEVDEEVVDPNSDMYNPREETVVRFIREANPVTYREVIHAVEYALENNLGNIRNLYQNYMEEVRPDLEGIDLDEDLQFFVKFVYLLYNDNKTVEDLNKQVYTSKLPSDSYNALLNLFGFLNLFGVDIESVINAFKPIEEFIARRKNMAEKRGREFNLESTFAMISNRDELQAINTEVIDLLQPTILNTMRPILDNINRVFELVELDKISPTGGKYGKVTYTRSNKTLLEALVNLEIYRRPKK